MAPAKVPVSISIPINWYETLRELAHEEAHDSLSRMIRILIYEALERRGIEVDKFGI